MSLYYCNEILHEIFCFFSGMVTCMDEAIKNVTETLKEAGMYDDTIIVFSTGTGLVLYVYFSSFTCISYFCFHLFRQRWSSSRWREQLAASRMEGLAVGRRYAWQRFHTQSVAKATGRGCQPTTDPRV